MFFFAALAVFSAILVVVLLKSISKFGSLVQWCFGLEMLQDRGKLSTNNLMQENLNLKLQLLEKQKALERLSPHGLAVSERPSTEPKAGAESVEAILAEIAHMDLFKSIDGNCWHIFEECVAQRARGKVAKLRPCAVCARKLKTAFSL